MGKRKLQYLYKDSIDSSKRQKLEDLFTFIEDNNIDGIRCLLKNNSNIDINKCNEDGETPLYTACMYGYLEIAQLLLEQPNIDLNTRDRYGQSALYIACDHLHLEIVKLLFTHKNIDIGRCWCNDRGECLLWAACVSQNVRIVRFLLKQENIDVNYLDIYNQTPLFIAVGRNNKQIIRLLLRHKDIDVNKYNVRNESPLSKACVSKDIETIQLLVQHPSIEIIDKYYDTLYSVFVKLNMNAYKEDFDNKYPNQINEYKTKWIEEFVLLINKIKENL